MRLAEHIIGLALSDRQDCETSRQSVQSLYAQIRASGVLRPLAERRFGDHGNTFDLDALAGDNQYVFLSSGARYRDNRPDWQCYGFVFDAEQLVMEHGALVGPDLLHFYDDILDEVVREVESSLPPLPQISEEELAEFVAMMGTTGDAMVEHLRQSSTSRYHELCDAVREGDFGVEGAEQATALFIARVRLLQVAERRQGREALSSLSGDGGMEVLVLNFLPLSLAVGVIEEGRIIFNKGEL